MNTMSTIAVFRNQRLIWLLIFFLTISTRLAMVFAMGLYSQSDFGEPRNVAESLVTLGVFGNPYSIPTGPTAHLSPGFPLLLSLLLGIVGSGPEGQVMQFLLSIAVVAEAYCLLPSLSDSLGLGRLPGATAGIFAAAFPLHGLTEVWGRDHVFALLFMILLTLYTINSWSQSRFDHRTAFKIGIVSGLAILFNPSLLFVIFFLVTFPLCFHYQQRRRLATFVAVIGITIVATLSPWAIRNYYVLGSVVFLRDDFGLELHVSNNDFARANGYDNRRSAFATYHPLISKKEAEAVAEIGEIAYMRGKLAAAMDWIRNNPRRFLDLTVQRFMLFWFPVTTRPLQTMLLWLLTLGSIVSLCILCRRVPLAAFVIGGIWVVYPLVYYFLQADIRYRYPIYWTFVLLCSWLSIFLWNGYRQKIKLWRLSPT